MKENVLRKKLRDLGIPDWGAKSLLQRRHTEWVNLNNANCDSKNPKSKKELLKELDLWERSQGGQAILYHRDQTPSVMRKDFDGGAWSAAHGGDFKKLIENARKGRDAETRPASSEPAPAPASVLVPTPGPVPTPTAISTSAESPPSAAEDSGNPQTATPTAAVVEPQATPDNPTISERSDKAELSCRKPAESDSAPPALEGQRQRFVVEDAAA